MEQPMTDWTGWRTRLLFILSGAFGTVVAVWYVIGGGN